MWKVSGAILVHGALNLVGYSCASGMPGLIILGVPVAAIGIIVFGVGITPGNHHDHPVPFFGDHATGRVQVKSCAEIQCQHQVEAKHDELNIDTILRDRQTRLSWEAHDGRRTAQR